MLWVIASECRRLIREYKQVQRKEKAEIILILGLITFTGVYVLGLSTTALAMMALFFRG